MKTGLLVLFLFAANVAAESEPMLQMAGNTNYGQSGYQQAQKRNPVYDVLIRLDQLQQEVRILRGQVEEQAYAIEQLKKQQQTMYTDLDERLQKTENPDSGTTQSP